MSFTLGSPQCFAIIVILFGFLGFLQGWKRTVVLMGFTLAAVLFLYIGGANGIAQIFFVRIPQTINVLTGGAIGPKSPPPPSTSEVLISELLVLGLAMILGFVIGGRAFPSSSEKFRSITYTYSAHTSERFLGIIPGLVTGFALITYLSHILAGNQTLSVGATAPSQSSLGSYIVILVVICIVAIIVALLTSRLGK